MLSQHTDSLRIECGFLSHSIFLSTLYKIKSIIHYPISSFISTFNEHHYAASILELKIVDSERLNPFHDSMFILSLITSEFEYIKYFCHPNYHPIYNHHLLNLNNCSSTPYHYLTLTNHLTYLCEVFS